MSDLYDTDFQRWTEQQTKLLRQRAAGHLVNDEGLDWLNLAEESESGGASQQREVRSRRNVICQHPLKGHHQPGRRSPSWRNTLYVQRRDLLNLFEDSPSWRIFAGQLLPKSCVTGRQDAEREAGVLGVCPWSLDQVLTRDFLPD